jgi:hypothetical protein
MLGPSKSRVSINVKMIRSRGRAVSMWLATAMALAALYALPARAEEVSSAEVEAPVQSTSTATATTTAGAQKPSFSLFSRYPLTFSLSLDTGYDTNVSTTGTNSSQGSAYTEGRANMSFDAGTERSHLSITAGTDVNYFYSHATNPNPEVNTVVGLTGRYNVSQRLTLNMNVSAAYQAEPDFSADIGPNQRVGYFITNTDTLSAAYQWSSLISTVSTETFMVVNYDKQVIGSFEDRIENTLGEQVRFALSMRTALVAEYRFDIIDYSTFPRDSNSHYVLGGIDHTFNPRVNVTLRGGATFRSYTGDNGLTTEPQFEGTLNYAIGRKSSLSWVTTYGLEVPNSPTVANTTAFRTGVQLTYGLTSRISSAAAAYYIHDDNQLFNTPGAATASDMSDDSYLVSLNLQYSFNRHLAFHVGFDASGANASTFGTSYNRQRYSAGLNFTF